MYPDALETLTALQNLGIRLIAYTDSKYYAARGRIERLGLEDIFETVYCREKSTSSPLKRLGASERDPPRGKVMELPSHEAKPNPRILGNIIAVGAAPLRPVVAADADGQQAHGQNGDGD